MTTTETPSADIDRLVMGARQAFETLKHLTPERLAECLRRLADACTAAAAELTEIANAETSLGLPRLNAELGRTTNQLRAFAQVAVDRHWTQPTIDLASPQRKPAAKPDLRKMLRPLGPVIVFPASNFPFAFGVLGGDTASALAARNPVVVKAHPAHPKTSYAFARLAREAVEQCDLPEGTLGMLHSSDPAIAGALVEHPHSEAVGFTGSLRAGRALFNLASARPRPIPVYAEMGSINPLFVLPAAMQARGGAIAAGLAQSLALGCGQFCTKPGVTIVQNGAALRPFLDALVAAVNAAPIGDLLHANIADNFRRRLDHLRKQEAVTILTEGAAAAADGKRFGNTLLLTPARNYLGNVELQEEAFGPVGMVVIADDAAELAAVAHAVAGSLTATIHADAADEDAAAGLARILDDRVGRLIFNGYPTGVEVSPAMHHGGPYPATTSALHTSVGASAIVRWAKPVCYQDCPPHLLPEELRDENPRQLMRQVDGQWTAEAVMRP